MQKISFKDDYSIGAHPRILQAIHNANKGIEESYGNDSYSKKAEKKIKKIFACQNSSVHFVSSGTQANLLVISAALKPYESVIAAHTGHIHLHETGAIEAAGHKINTIETKDGKLSPALIRKILDAHHTPPHMVKPKMVYISNATELGTVYTLNELENLSLFCRQNHLYLYLDGARLGNALTTNNDIKASDICKLTDAFYIGGTKNGGMFGEAIVIKNKQINENFEYLMKQKGALIAKSRYLGAQFEEFFHTNLYFELAKRANTQAKKLLDKLKPLNVKFDTINQTNQIFPILPSSVVRQLTKDFDFYIWENITGELQKIRLVTSWKTTDDEIDFFIDKIDNYLKS